MSDLESRLGGALRDGAEAAPSAIGLAGAARRRARQKRRTRLAGGAAVLALGIGIPTAVVLTGDDPATGPKPSQDDTTVAQDPVLGHPGLPNGYHYESWHDITIEVPNTWGYGSMGSWCAGGGSVDTPLVQRPETVSEMIACEPATGYGVSFQEVDNTDDFRWPTVHQSEGWPKDAVVGGRGIGGVLVMVSAREPTVAEYVLDSMRKNPTTDPNGCPVRVLPGETAPPEGAMSVCRYDGTGALEQSEALVAENASEAVQALTSGSDSSSCTDTSKGSQPHPVILMESPGLKARIDLAEGCATLTVNGLVRPLTPEVLYWALSPGWSGSVPDGVSLPSVLRTR